MTKTQLRIISNAIATLHNEICKGRISDEDAMPYLAKTLGLDFTDDAASRGKSFDYQTFIYDCCIQ